MVSHSKIENLDRHSMFKERNDFDVTTEICFNLYDGTYTVVLNFGHHFLKVGPCNGHRRHVH